VLDLCLGMYGTGLPLLDEVFLGPSALESIGRIRKERQTLSFDDRIKQQYVTPDTIMKGTTIRDCDQWYREHDDDCYAAAPQDIYDLLDHDESKQSLALDNLRENFSIETAEHISNAMNKVFESGTNNVLFEKMIMQLGRIGYINKDKEKFREIMLSLTHKLFKILGSQHGKADSLLDSAYRSLFLLGVWDSEEKKKELWPSHLFEESDREKVHYSVVGGLYPYIWNYVESRTIGAIGSEWLFVDFGCYHDGDTAKMVTYGVEQTIQRSLEVNSWKRLSEEGRKNLLKKLFINMTDPLWAIFKGYFMPECIAVVKLVNELWQPEAISSISWEQFDPDDLAEALRKKTLLWSEYLRVPNLALQILACHGSPAKYLVSRYNEEIREIFSASLKEVRKSTDDTNVLFHLGYAAQLEKKRD